MKKLKYLLFFFIIFLSRIVFADTSYDMTSRITSPVNYSECGAGSYTGVELNGATNCWNTKTRYQGTLNRIYFNLPAPTGSVFESDTAYRLTIKMATDDWRNNFGTVVVSPGSSYTNNFVDTFTFVSMKQVNITFTVPYTGSTTYQYLYVNLPAKNSSSLITGVSNWNLSNVTLTKLTSGSGGGSSTPSGPSTTFDDTAIINSGKENTQDIINNNNNNTQDVINNNNHNTEEIKNTITDNLNNCRNSHNLFNINGEININGSNNTTHTNANSVNNNILIANTFNDYGYGQVFDNLNGKTVTFSAKLSSKGSSDGGIFVIYDNNVVVNTTYLFNVGEIYSYTYTCTSNNIVFGFTSYNALGAEFTDIQVNEGSSRLSYEPYGQVCTSKIDDVNNSINNSTSTIINNQNENVNKQIESQNVCTLYDKEYIEIDNRVLNPNNGSIFTNTSYGISKYIKITKNSKIKSLTTQTDTAGLCFYNINKSLINCINVSALTINDLITIPDNSSYMRFTIRKSNNKPQIELCENGNQAVNDTLTDSNIDNGVGTGFFDGFTSQDFGLSQIITIPLNTIQSLTSKSCVPLQVPIPFTNSNISLPCMTEIYESKFPSIYNLWKIVSFGIVAYLIAIDIFHIVKGFKDPESDKVEVLDL